MVIKISEELVGDEVHQLEKELTRELTGGTLTVARMRAAVDACLARMGVVSPSRLLAQLKERTVSPALEHVDTGPLVVKTYGHGFSEPVT